MPRCSSNQHVLVAEQSRVTERNLSGKVLWKVEGIQPVCVQRLPNGNTFIPCNEHAHRGEPGRQRGVPSRPCAGVAAARRLPDGRIVAFDRNAVIQLDKAGKEVKRVGVMIGGAGCNEVLDNGHVLTLSPGMGNMTEFDQGWKANWRFRAARSRSRFPSAERAYVGHGARNEVLGTDEKFKPIKETALPAPAFRVKQR